ncbi:hypothetical protein ACFL4G_02745 [Thermodesulfobacteriota bacterium]
MKNTAIVISLSMVVFLCGCETVRPHLGFWAHPESIGYAELTGWLDAFAEKGAALYIAVDKEQIMRRDPNIADLIRAAGDRGVEIRTWILVPYSEGYYPNEENFDSFFEAVREMIAWAGEEELPFQWITVDMEPSIHILTQMTEYLSELRLLAALELLLAQVDRPAFEQSLANYASLVAYCHDHGFLAHVVTFPTVLDDLEDGDLAFQDALNVPVHPLPYGEWDDVDFMVYRTEISGIPGLPFGPELVWSYASDAVAVFGDRASVSLGIVGPDGGYDNYNTPDEILPDLRAAVTAGIGRVNVFSFSGAVAMPGPEAWLDLEVQPMAKPLPDPVTRGMRLLFQLADRLIP